MKTKPPIMEDRDALLAELETLRAENQVLRQAVERFSQCDPNYNNCASLEVATRRIRNIANMALNALEEHTGKTGRRVYFKTISSAQRKADELNAL